MAEERKHLALTRSSALDYRNFPSGFCSITHKEPEEPLSPEHARSTKSCSF